MCKKKTKSESWQKSRNDLESYALFLHGDLFLLPKIFSFPHNKLKKSRSCSYFNVSLTFVKAADQRHMAMFLFWSIEYRESLSVSLRSFMPSTTKWTSQEKTWIKLSLNILEEFHSESFDFCPFLGWPFHDSYCVPKECNPGSFDFRSLLGSLMRWLGTSLILFPWSSLCPRGVYAWGKSVGIRHKVRSPSLLPINMVEGG